MLSRDDLLALYECWGLPDQARAVIDQVRSSSPARRVRSGRGNVSGSYPSRKMGATIQFESHRVELAAVYEMEHDPGVLEFFDQPPSIKLLYESANRKRMGVLHTPDFFVIWQDKAGWEEWKQEEDRTRLAEKNPNRYQRDGDGKWRCRPGEEYSKPLGLYYGVRSSREIDWVFQRNIQFLEDYLRSDTPGCAPGVSAALLGYVHTTPGLSLESLFRLAEGDAGRDDIYNLIATGAICVDLRAAPLTEPARIRIFAPGDQERRQPGGEPAICGSPQDLAASVSCTIAWDGRERPAKSGTRQ